MIELGIFVAFIILVWRFRKPIQVWSEVQAEKADLWATDAKVDMQDDLAELDSKVEAVKKAHGDKWYTLSSITSKMQ